MGRKNNERERGEWNKKSNLPYILLELREFECQSFHQFLTWKEKITTHFMHNQLGKSLLMTVQMMKLVVHFHALEMHELLSSAMLGTTIHDVEIEIPARINGLSTKLTKKVGKVLIRNLECNVHIITTSG